MERVAVAGLSLHQTDVEGLERAKRALAALEDPAAKALADRLGASEAVLISTCNRLELVFARENGHAPAREDRAALAEALGLAPGSELGERLFLHAGRSAARHLFRVTASLDSLVLGEDQIMAQVRAAHAEAHALGLSGRILGPLFEQAIQLGKRVRTCTELARHPVSVVSLGVGFLIERVPPGARIALVGAGATAAHAARALAAAGLAPAFVANRSSERAHALADEIGARVLSLEALRAGAESVDALVCATSAPGWVLDRGAQLRLAARVAPARPLVAVDLALPRDLEPCDDPRIEAIDLESLRARAEANRRKRSAAAAEAEILVEDQLARLFRERSVEAVTGPYALVASRAREAFELELARLRDGRVARLDPRDRLAVERWARVAFGRVAHEPFRMLKRLVRADALPRGEWEGFE